MRLPSPSSLILSTGIVKEKVCPCRASLSTQMRPPWASTTILQKVRPRPVDIFGRALRVSTWPNFSKIRCERLFGDALAGVADGEDDGARSSSLRRARR